MFQFSKPWTAIYIALAPKDDRKCILNCNYQMIKAVDYLTNEKEQ